MNPAEILSVFAQYQIAVGQAAGLKMSKQVRENTKVLLWCIN